VKRRWLAFGGLGFLFLLVAIARLGVQIWHYSR
jgi:hypothetical protein